MDDNGPADYSQGQDNDNQILPGESNTLIAGNGDAVGGGQLADNDLLAAVTPVSWDTLDNVGDNMLSTMPSLPCDGVDSIGHTLDHLTSATNLFDVPPVDFDTPTGS